MPPAIASLTTRLFDAAGAGRAARIGLLAALHLAALAILLATESTLASRGAYLLTWGLLNCAVSAAAAPPGGRGRAVARPAHRADPAVAVQARGAADDGELRRPDDHRRRHLRVPDEHLSPARHARWRSRSRCSLTALGPDLVTSIRCGCGGAMRSPARCRASAAWSRCRSPCRTIRGRSSTARTTCRNSRARASTAISDLIDRAACWSPMPAVSERLAVGAADDACSRRQAAAHHHGVRRVELRHPAAARRQGAGRLRRAFPVRSTASSARCWWKARAARAGTPNTTCSPACRRAPTAASPTSSRASPPAGSSAACRRRCGAAATRPSRSIRVWRVPRARAASRDRPASQQLPRLQGPRRARSRARLVLLRQGGRDDREASAARARCSCSSISRQPLSRGTSAFAPICAPDWRDLGNARRCRRISAPPGP